MHSSKIAVKFFVRDATGIDPHAYGLAFHHWIQTHALPDHLLIDVADYRHVPTGPGTVLVAHEANLSIDSANNQLGLLYLRKQSIDGDLATRIKAVFRAELLAASLLEQAPSLAGKLSFRTDNPLLRINDRLLAPNTAETFRVVQPALQTFLAKLYGNPVQLTHQPNDETLFQVQIAAPSSLSVADLLKRLG